ncbi:MAG: hypothetical protein IJ220_07820 [Clostridia bacterium]|nr:hypothetical protein [Clostridia bacterium]
MSSGFNIKVKMNSTSKIIKDHGLDKDGKVTAFLRDTVERLSDPYIPFDSGLLRKLKTKPSNHEIKYTSPYAKFQYYGKLMLTKTGSSWARKGEKKSVTNKDLKYHTSGTGARWEQLMLQRRKNDLIRDVENYIKRG